jgi:hypothetical protein
VTNQTSTSGSREPGSEQALLDAIANPQVSRDEITQMLARAASLPFARRAAWAALVRDEALEAWRRLAALQLLVTRATTYPCLHDEFLDTVIAAAGVPREKVIGRSFAQNLPFALRPGESVSVASTDIRAAIGMVTIYFAVNETTNTVERAAVHPASIEAEA